MKYSNNKTQATPKKTLMKDVGNRHGVKKNKT